MLIQCICMRSTVTFKKINLIYPADTDECEQENICEEEHMECHNVPGSHYCDCEDGYDRVGNECVDKALCKYQWHFTSPFLVHVSHLSTSTRARNSIFLVCVYVTSCENVFKKWKCHLNAQWKWGNQNLQS